MTLDSSLRENRSWARLKISSAVCANDKHVNGSAANPIAIAAAVVLIFMPLTVDEAYGLRYIFKPPCASLFFLIRLGARWPDMLDLGWHISGGCGKPKTLRTGCLSPQIRQLKIKQNQCLRGYGFSPDRKAPTFGSGPFWSR
jgi:hypothetical protein